MKISEIQNGFHQKKIITFANDGCTAVTKKMMLQQISGYLYKGKDNTDPDHQVHCRFYVFYPELDIGLDVGGVMYPGEMTVEEVAARVDPAMLKGPNAVIAELDRAVAEGGRVMNAQIELARHIVPERVDGYIQARQHFLDLRAAQEERARQKRAEEHKAFCQAKNAEAQKQLEQALEIIRSGGKLENHFIAFYPSYYDCRSYRIINYLARKYGVNIPLKVQGWINGKLIQVTIQDGHAERIRHTGKISKTIWKYLNQLIEAVCLEQNISAEEERIAS